MNKLLNYLIDYICYIYYTIYQYLTEVLMFDENEMKTNPIAKEFIEEK